jgi:hypothetical protein
MPSGRKKNNENEAQCGPGRRPLLPATKLKFVMEVLMPLVREAKKKHIGDRNGRFMTAVYEEATTLFIDRFGYVAYDLDVPEQETPLSAAAEPTTQEKTFRLEQREAIRNVSISVCWINYHGTYRLIISV